MSKRTPSMPKQNRRHRARHAARKAGRRQKPGLHEHNIMMRGLSRYDPDNDNDYDTPGAADAAGETAAP